MTSREAMETEVQRWRESGLKKKEYCGQRGISESTFSYWITRVNKRKENAFLPLLPTGVHNSTIEVIYPNGVRIKVATADLKAIAALISLC